MANAVRSDYCRILSAVARREPTSRSADEGKKVGRHCHRLRRGDHDSADPAPVDPEKDGCRTADGPCPNALEHRICPFELDLGSMSGHRTCRLRLDSPVALPAQTSHLNG